MQAHHGAACSVPLEYPTPTTRGSGSGTGLGPVKLSELLSNVVTLDGSMTALLASQTCMHNVEQQRQQQQRQRWVRMHGVFGQLSCAVQGRSNRATGHALAAVLLEVYAAG
jgi:hypothetical protein